jgi:hypothetical protein
MKLACVLSSRSAKAGKEKLAGKRENSVGIEDAKDPVAGIRGVPLLNENEETITNARVVPTLELFSGQRFVSRNQGNTYATQSPNKKKVRQSRSCKPLYSQHIRKALTFSKVLKPLSYYVIDRGVSGNKSASHRLAESPYGEGKHIASKGRFVLLPGAVMMNVR